jgi:DNA-binding transcriptional ArsR family regulator
MPVVGHEFVIVSRAEWQALISPVRFEVMEFLRMLAPCSIAELGAAMARPADGLYHHLRVLQRIGIVRRVDDRIVRGRREAVFDLTARRFRFDVGEPAGPGKSPRNARLAAKLMAALGRMSVRNVNRAIEVGVAVGSGNSKQIWGRVEAAWLDDEALAEVNHHLEALDAAFERGRQVRRGRLFSLGLFLAPVARQPRRSSRSAGPASPTGAKTWIIPHV